jgi:hypothetical protein
MATNGDPWGIPRALRQPSNVPAKKPYKQRLSKTVNAKTQLTEALTPRDRNLRRLYGITLADYDALFQAQGGVCAICGFPERHPTSRNRTVSTNLHVDHDHKFGNVRALLCSSCNQGIGYFKHDQTLLEAAIRYLTDHTTESAWKLA